MSMIHETIDWIPSMLKLFRDQYIHKARERRKKKCFSFNQRLLVARRHSSPANERTKEDREKILQFIRRVKERQFFPPLLFQDHHGLVQNLANCERALTRDAPHCILMRHRVDRFSRSSRFAMKRGAHKEASYPAKVFEIRPLVPPSSPPAFTTVRCAWMREDSPSIRRLRDRNRTISPCDPCDAIFLLQRCI